MQLFRNFNGREKTGKLIHFANFHFIDQENRSSPISQANSRTLPKIHDGFPFSAINTEPILVLTISRAEGWLYSRVSVPYSSGAVGCRCSKDCRTHSLGGQRHAELDKYRHNFLNSSGISPGVSFAQRPPSGCPWSSTWKSHMASVCNQIAGSCTLIHPRNKPTQNRFFIQDAQPFCAWDSRQ